MQASPKKVFWKKEEYLIVFSEMMNYLESNRELPKNSKVEEYKKFQSLLPIDRQKRLSPSGIWLLNKGFDAYIKKDNAWYDVCRQKVKTVTIEVTPSFKEVKEELREKAVQAMKPKEKDVAVLVSESLMGMNKLFSDLVKVVGSLESKIDTSILITKGLNESKEEDQPKKYVSPDIVRISSGKVTHDPFNLNRELFNGTVRIKETHHVLPIEIEQKPFGDKLPEDAFGTFESKEKVAATETPPSIASTMTEEYIRNIVRSEIEKIFGPINKHPVVEMTSVVTEVKTTSPGGVIGPVFTKIVKEEKKTEPVNPLVPLRIFVYGINSTQSVMLQEGLPLNVKIDSMEVFNQNTKDKAKNCDQIIVTKYSKHSTYESLRSVCGIDKVCFVSGGMTMLKRKINELADKQIVRK